MKIYLVGGAVRDQLLGLPVVERDWLVTGATDVDMLEAGYQPVHGGFPVFQHPQTGEEYALARRETKNGPGYHGFSLSFGPEITVDEDLARRDLTINAMAIDEQGILIDPFRGQDDLDAGLLRHVTPAFHEDPVRVLRVARFAAKLGRWGFRVAHGTHGLMKKMAESSDFCYLKRERFWQELKKALTTDQPWRFFEVLQRCGALPHLLPCMAEPMANKDGHRQGIQSAPIIKLKQAAESCADPLVRMLALLYELHVEGVTISRLQHELPLDKSMVTALEGLSGLEPIYQSRPDGKQLLDACWLRRRAANWDQLNQVLELRHPGHQQQADALLTAAGKALRLLSAGDLQTEGYSGAALGAELKKRQLATIQAVLEQGA